MSQPAAKPRVIRFGLYELDLEGRQLRKSGVRVKLQEQPFQILCLLLERSGSVVTREELQKKLWPGDTFVEFDLSLNSAVKKLRQALSDDSENPRFIETLYRRGYRFIGPMNGSAHPNFDPVEAAAGPELVTLTAPAQVESSIATGSSKGRRVVYVAVVLLVLLAALVGLFWHRLVPPQAPRVLAFDQITNDGSLKTGVFSDGERLYFSELTGDRFQVAQVSVAGGETSILPTPFANVGVVGITPDESALVVLAFEGTGKGAEKNWLLPLPSGAPRRMGDFRIDSLAAAPDGKHAGFSVRQDIYLANSDLSEPRKLVTMANLVEGIHFSPDSRRLRFDVYDPRNGASAIWETDRDGQHSRPLLEGWSRYPRECCGNWTPDGRYFLFQSVQNGRASIWALAERANWLAGPSKPVQLTNGPLDFTQPVPSRDGKRIFALGSQPRCEMIRYDGTSGFAQYLDGRSIRDVAFSPDGKWVAYVTVPEGHLWRSRVDGSDRFRLTPDGMETGLPRWSPDGKRIAFMGTDHKTDFLAYLISSDGTRLRKLIPDAEAGYDPGWSPDGKSIVLSPSSGGQSANQGIIIYDLETGTVSPVPGSKPFFSPRWSPDGRYIAAITNDSTKLMLFDRTSQQWQELVSLTIGYPSWSHDGQYIYFDTALNEDSAFYRVRISDHRLERLFSLKGMRRYWGPFGPWTGLTPDDTPLLVRDISSQEIYALDWQAP